MIYKYEYNSALKKRTSSIWEDMNEPERHYAKWKKQPQKENTVLSQLCVVSTKVQLTKHSRILIVGNLRGKMGDVGDTIQKLRYAG